MAIRSFADLLKGLKRSQRGGGRRSHRVRLPGHPDRQPFPRSAKGHYGQEVAIDWEAIVDAARGGFQFKSIDQETGKVDEWGGWMDGPYDVSSSWVRKIGYFAHRGEQGVAVQFKSGAICFYPGADYSVFRGIEAASSKGKFVHQVLYDRPYLVVG